MVMRMPAIAPIAELKISSSHIAVALHLHRRSSLGSPTIVVILVGL
jgi:hypothetical protein